MPSFRMPLLQSDLDSARCRAIGQSKEHFSITADPIRHVVLSNGLNIALSVRALILSWPSET